MAEILKSSYITNALLSRFSKSILDTSFVEYKSKQFIKVTNEVLQLIRLFPNRNDTYIWYAVYPLIQNDINFGMGVGAVRYPSEGANLVITDKKSLVVAEEKIAKGLEEAFVYFDERSSLEAICSLSGNNLAGQLVKSFCLARLGRAEDARKYAEAFVSSGFDIANTRKGALDLLESINDSKCQSYLDSNIKGNIKKLNISKYVATT